MPFRDGEKSGFTKKNINNNKMKKVIAGIAAVAMFAVASPALAWHWSSSDIDVEVKNSGTTVFNGVSTGAYTGGNTADGGSASTKVKNRGNINGSKDDY